MKPFYSKLSALFSLLFLWAGLSSWAPAVSPDKYCNNRYGFCIEYPGDLFTKKFISENNDGVVLTSTDGNAQVRASGYYNVMDWGVEDEYNDFKEVVRASNKTRIQEVSVTFEGDQFECTLLVGEKVHYQKTVQKGDHFITLSIVTNVKGKENPAHAIENLKEVVRLEVDS